MQLDQQTKLVNDARLYTTSKGLVIFSTAFQFAVTLDLIFYFNFSTLLHADSFLICRFSSNCMLFDMIVIITVGMMDTGWTAKEWTAFCVWVIECDAVADNTLGLDARRSPFVSAHFLQQQTNNYGAITSKIKHAMKLKTSPARLAQLLHNCCSPH